MRHSAISEDEVDFQEHYATFLASVVAWTLSKQTCGSLQKLCYAARFGFYAPGPNWPHVLEWLEEVSCNYR
jgi:hypothetical protein